MNKKASFKAIIDFTIYLVFQIKGKWNATTLKILIVFICFHNTVNCKPNSDSIKIYNTLQIAEKYMDANKYDSALYYYNSIHKIITNTKNDTYLYYLLTRQAEIFYYSDLHIFGLEATKKMKAVALQTNDSTLIADAYNFLGLFYERLDSMPQSIEALNNAILYITPIKNYAKHIALSLPHHIYGNLADSYLKIKDYPKAIYYFNKSLQLATEQQKNRGQAIALNGMARVLIEENKIAQADSILLKALAVDSSIDIILYCYAGLTKTNFLKGDISKAKYYTQKAIAILNKRKQINPLYITLFLEDNLKICEKLNIDKELINILNNALENSKAVYNQSSRQVTSIIKVSQQFEENNNKLTLQNAEYKSKVRSYIILILLALTGLLAFVIYHKYKSNKAKLKLSILEKQMIEQEFTAYKEKQELIRNERNRILTDLHDDLGTGLTSIKMLTELALLNPENADNKAVEKIKTHATTLVQSLSDIVWEMNEKHDKNFIQYVIVYVTEYCNEHNINFNFYVDENVKNVVIDGLKRRNLFLVIKETLHNTIKHANATQINIKFLLQNSQLIITIHDNGKGIDVENLRAFGNGLKNMKARMNVIHGSYAVENNKGTLTTLILPI